MSELEEIHKWRKNGGSALELLILQLLADAGSPMSPAKLGQMLPGFAAGSIRNALVKLKHEEIIGQPEYGRWALISRMLGDA